MLDIAQTGVAARKSFMYIIDSIFVISTIVIPIIAVWRWSFLGVFIGMAVAQTLLTLVGVLRYLYWRSQNYQGEYFDSEYWEFWWGTLLLIFGYCLFIYFVKCTVLIIRKIVARIF